MPAIALIVITLATTLSTRSHRMSRTAYEIR